MVKKVGYTWHLRRLMAEHNMFLTRLLQPLLAERGVNLSREQAYRLLTKVPQRLSLDTLVALCDILDCTPNDLIEPQVVDDQNITVDRGAEVESPPAVQLTRIQRPSHRSPL